MTPRSRPDGDEVRTDEQSHAALISAALKAVRSLRGLTSTEVAAAMGLKTRTYEYFEAGTGKISYARISDFARATDSDPMAILSVVPLRSSQFAAACADNKLMTVVMTFLRDIDQELGSDITLLPTSILVAAFDRLSQDLIAHVRRSDDFADKWIEERASQIEGADFLRPKRQPTRKA